MLPHFYTMKKTIFLLTILSLLHTAFAQGGHFPVPFRCCDKWGFVEYGTKTPITAFEYDTVEVFFEDQSGMYFGNRAFVKKGKGACFIKPNGERIIEDERRGFFACLTSLGGRKTSFSTFKLGTKYGLMEDKKELIPALYDKLIPTIEGAFALKEGKWGIISAQNEIIHEFIWDNIQVMENTSYNWYFHSINYVCFGVCINNKWGLANAEGVLFIPYKYEAIGKLFDDQNLTTTVKPFGRKWGFIDMNGTEYFEETEEGCSE